jgi:hypothetical protein
MNKSQQENNRNRSAKSTSQSTQLIDKHIKNKSFLQLERRTAISTIKT